MAFTLVTTREDTRRWDWAVAFSVCAMRSRVVCNSSCSVWLSWESDRLYSAFNRLETKVLESVPVAQLLEKTVEP